MARRKKQRNHSEDNHERWLVSYADFITLMFAFFIVLYATSERNSKKTAEFEKSVRKFFVNVAGVAGTGDEKNLNEARKGDTLIKPPLPMVKTSSDEAAQAMDEVEVFLEEKLSQGDREKYLVDLSYDLYGVRLALDASRLFAENSIKFEKQALRTLDTVSFLLKGLNGRVIVESHVDRAEKRPEPFDTDWKLSSSRSSQVVEYMIRRHGLDPSRLATMAHGSQRPLYPEGDEKASRNQRLEFLILTEASPF